MSNATYHLKFIYPKFIILFSKFLDMKKSYQNPKLTISIKWVKCRIRLPFLILLSTFLKMTCSFFQNLEVDEVGTRIPFKLDLYF